MNRVWSPLAMGLRPYVPGEQPPDQDYIKLNTNENPYPPSPRVLEALREVLDARLRLYPPPESPGVREAIARRHGVAPAQVFVGNGSDEVLALAFLAYFSPQAPIRMPDISYSFYPVYAALYGMATDIVAVNEDFSLPKERMFDAPGGVIFANPNAPTSLALRLDDVSAIAANNGRIVIVDEAYVEFGAMSAVPLIAKHENLLVVKTFSKSHSLAGMRIGYALGRAETVQALYRVKNSFNSYPLDRLAQAAAIAAMQSEDYTQKAIARIVRTREDTAKALGEMGFEGPPSSANFLFVRHKDRDAKGLLSELRARAILVRHFDLPRIDGYLRISVGTEEEMARLVYALERILGT